MTMPPVAGLIRALAQSPDRRLFCLAARPPKPAESRAIPRRASVAHAYDVPKEIDMRILKVYTLWVMLEHNTIVFSFRGNIDLARDLVDLCRAFREVYGRTASRSDVLRLAAAEGLAALKQRLSTEATK